MSGGATALPYCPHCSTDCRYALVTGNSIQCAYTSAQCASGLVQVYCNTTGQVSNLTQSHAGYHERRLDRMPTVRRRVFCSEWRRYMQHVPAWCVDLTATSGERKIPRRYLCCRGRVVVHAMSPRHVQQSRRRPEPRVVSQLSQGHVLDYSTSHVGRQLHAVPRRCVESALNTFLLCLQAPLRPKPGRARARRVVRVTTQVHTTLERRFCEDIG